MTKPKISIVVAVTKKDRAIGKGSELLFRISDDLKRFKALTLGHPIIMGRKTFESIGKPLPERTNIVITRNPSFSPEGVLIAHSLDEALKKASAIDEEIFVIGGGEIYAETLPLADTLYLTLVESEKEGDVFFPDWKDSFTKELSREDRTDTKTGLRYTWLTLVRE